MRCLKNKKVIFMKNIIIFTLCCLPFCAFASSDSERTQMLEIDQLLTENCESVLVNTQAPGYTGKTFTTKNVWIETVKGYRFHVATYGEGTVVVTALNGSMEGCQGVGVNGIKIAESTAWEIHKGYFVHYYETGKIISYPKKQTLKYY